MISKAKGLGMLYNTVLKFAIAMTILFSGCANQPTEVQDYDPDPVLSAFIMEGEPVREIYLERVAPFDEYYDRQEHGIIGAEMILFTPGTDDTLHLLDDPAERGHYIAEDSTWLPQGGNLYRIEARFGSQDFVWAETLMPEPCTLTILPNPVDGDTLTRNDPNLVLQWTGSEGAGGYAMNVNSLAPRDSLIPLDPDFDPEEDEVEDNEKWQSFMWIMRDDQRTLTVPWITFQWVGRYRLDVMAVAQEYYDYVFASFRVGQGTGIDLPSNVNGGLGIFGATARHSFELYMEISDG